MSHFCRVVCSAIGLGESGVCIAFVLGIIVTTPDVHEGIQVAVPHNIVTHTTTQSAATKNFGLTVLHPPPPPGNDKGWGTTKGGVGLGWVGSRPHPDLRDHGHRPSLRVTTGPAGSRLSGLKAHRTDDRPRTRGGTRRREMPPCLCVWGARAAWESVSPGAPGPSGEAGGA